MKFSLALAISDSRLPSRPRRAVSRTSTSRDRFANLGSHRLISARSREPEGARCFLDLHISGGYIGGQLTTNTMRSRQLIGVITDPPGYTQNSIATIRLWKRR